MFKQSFNFFFFYVLNIKQYKKIRFSNTYIYTHLRFSMSFSWYQKQLPPFTLVLVFFICLWKPPLRLFRVWKKTKNKTEQMDKWNRIKRKKEIKKKKEKRREKNTKWFNNETTSLSGQCIYNLHAYLISLPKTLCVPFIKYIFFFFVSSISFIRRKITFFFFFC